MFLWLAFVDVIRAALLVLSQAAGGNTGAGILALSVLVRVALLPLAVRVALRGRDASAKLRTLESQLKRLRDQHKKDPARAWAETRALQQQHGIRVLPKGSVLNMAVQLPLGFAVYRVVVEGASRAGRFLWVADLARPDVLITALAATTASLALLFAPSNNAGNRSMALVTAIVTVMIVWRLAAGVGLYWVGSSVVGIAQSLIVRRLSARR